VGCMRLAGVSNSLDHSRQENLIPLCFQAHGCESFSARKSLGNIPTFPRGHVLPIALFDFQCINSLLVRRCGGLFSVNIMQVRIYRGGETSACTLCYNNI
jgi:hypothetical protein